MSPILLVATLVAGPLAQVQHHVLDNGLTLLLLEDHRTPLVSVAAMYRAGAGNEAPGITGVAHYVEHMAFRDLEGFPGSEATDSVTRIGGRWNGYTWIDQTYYAETVQREALEGMLEIEARRMRGALFEPEAFEKERTSVLAELHSYDDPHSLLYDAVLATSFEIHPYRYNTIGWLSDVEGIGRDEAYAFYRRHYHPGNAVLVLVGDMDAGETLDLVGRHFGGLAGGGGPSEIRTVEPRQSGRKRVVIRRPGPHAEVLVAYRAPALTEADFPTMVLFDALIAGGKGLRFTRDYAISPDTPLRLSAVGSGLARETSSDWQASRYPYVYLLGAEATPGSDLNALESALLGTVKAASRREWSDAEIETALQDIRRGMSLDHDTLAGRAHQLAFFEVAGPQRLARVTRKDLARFATDRLGPEQATVGWFVPTDEALSEAPASIGEVASTESPEGLAPESPSRAVPAEPVTYSLDNGFELSVAPAPTAGLVALVARIDAGALYDGAMPGLSALATEHLAAAASGPAVQWTLHERPTAAVNARWIELEAYCLPEELDALLESLTVRLRAAPPSGPAWTELLEAARRRADPAAEVGGAIWKHALGLLYPADTPLGSPAWADSEALAAVGEAALRRFLFFHVTPPRTHLALAGALDPGSVRERVQELLGSWDAAPAASDPEPPAAAGAMSWTEVHVAFPSKAQNEIAVFWPGDRSQPADMAATRALAYLLGETHYAGRLGRALVVPGLVYSVWTRLEEDGAPGFLVVRTAAAPEHTREVLARIRRILEEAVQGRFAAAELAEAQSYLRGKTSRLWDGTLSSARQMLQRSIGRPEPLAEALTLDELNAAARRMFRHGHPIAIVAGPGYGEAEETSAGTTPQRPVAQ